MPTGTDHLDPDESLAAGQSLLSFNRKYELAYQDDGNLVVYSNGAGGKDALWASNTAGRASVTCAMQGDGNLVIYDASGVPLWATSTYGNAGSKLFMQDDGNAVIYSSGGVPVWASNTPQATQGPFKGSCEVALSGVGVVGVTARLDFGGSNTILFDGNAAGLGAGVLAGGAEFYQSSDDLVSFGEVVVEIQIFPVYFQMGWRKLDGAILGSVQGAGLSLPGYAVGRGSFRF